MNKKYVAIYTGQRYRYSSQLTKDIAKRIYEEGIPVRKYTKVGPLRIITPCVDIRVVCYNDEILGLRFDEVFNFDPYIAMDLRKSHSEEGYSGSLLDYVFKEHRKLGLI